MKSKVKYIILAAAFVILFAAAAIGYQFLSERYEAPESGIPESEPQVVMAPDFTVLDEEGNSVKLSDFVGKPVVVNFWATWCGPCKSELPAFENACKTYGEDVVFLMVNMTDGVDETVEGVQEFLEENGYELPVYFDTEYSAAIAYGVSSIPMTVFIYEDGSGLGVYRGAISEETLNKYTEMVRDGEAP